ncbi:hypothetical protein [Pseudanabaena sp. 'Roaring Creek']|uniref:hypothetical protein n=1 Tax=Pseudanabaena sp. 'Roaring Creek' TaxID=1681830 RepID=UPI0006D80E35|nr:hypothetical protein [Pseudanabaena sp. 'Roaring Creek']
MSNPIVFVYLIYTFCLGQIKDVQVLQKYGFTWLSKEKLQTSLTTLLALNLEKSSYSFNEDDFPNKGVIIDAKIIPYIFIAPINKIRNNFEYTSKVPIIRN